MRKHKFTFPFLILAFMLVIFSRITAGITANDLALQVEKKYRSFKSLSMDFIKTIRSEILETENWIKGKMIL